MSGTQTRKPREKRGLCRRCCESLQIGVALVLTRGPHLNFEAPQWSKIGVHKTRQKHDPQQNVCTSLAGSYSSPQATTARKKLGTLLVRCVTTSGAPASSHGQPEATHEMFLRVGTCEQQHQNLPESLKHFKSRAGA